MQAGLPHRTRCRPLIIHWRQKPVRTNCHLDPPPRTARRPPARRPPRQPLGTHRSPRRPSKVTSRRVDPRPARLGQTNPPYVPGVEGCPAGEPRVPARLPSSRLPSDGRSSSEVQKGARARQGGCLRESWMRAPDISLQVVGLNSGVRGTVPARRHARLRAPPGSLRGYQMRVCSPVRRLRGGTRASASHKSDREQGVPPVLTAGTYVQPAPPTAPRGGRKFSPRVL